MPKKAPPLGPIQRGGVALPFLNRGIKMTIHDRHLVGRVAEALRKLPSDPGRRPVLDRFAAQTFAAKLRPFASGTDDPIEYAAAELTRSIQAGILMDQVPEFDRLTDKQKLVQLDALDAAITQLDEALGQLRHETWDEIVTSGKSVPVQPDLPPEPTIVREGIYNLWRGLHKAVREARRHLQNSASNRGDRKNGPAARAANEARKMYQYITGKEAKIYWDAAAGEYKGQCLSFVAEIFRIFDIAGDPATYLRKD